MIYWYVKGFTLIISFADAESTDIFNGVNSKKARKRLNTALWGKAQVKLDMVNRAHKLDDLKIPPNNKLEKLGRDLVGYHSIRINDQYRIVFKWDPNKRGALEVKITDYH
jgi:proteic killer suppression protein